LHRKPQTPLVHVAVPPVGAMQVLSQLPQWLASVWVLEYVPPHRVSAPQSAAQTRVAAPPSPAWPRQTSPLPHARVHEPQCAGSVRFVSQPGIVGSQSPWSLSQPRGPMTQRPALHAKSVLPPLTPGSALQSVVHAPQWATSAARSTHCPLQRVIPAGQGFASAGTPSGAASSVTDASTEMSPSAVVPASRTKARSGMSQPARAIAASATAA
jgi:hypothetical protein